MGSRPDASESLFDYFEKVNLVVISDVDTRALVSYIRENGAMNSVICTDGTSIEELKEKLALVPNMKGLELASKVSTKTPYFFGNENATYKIAALDLGIKTNILRCLDTRDCYVKVFPYNTTFEELITRVQELSIEYVNITGTEVNRIPTTLVEAQTSPESYYYWIRSRFNALLPEDKCNVNGSAMILFLNKTCFRGVYREGPRGFNVPFGHYKNTATIIDPDHIRTVSELIRGVEFKVASFEQVFSELTFDQNTFDQNTFMYLDPPYVPKTETSFVGYTADGFSGLQHEYLFDECAKLLEKNVKFVLSNAHVPLVILSFPVSLYTVNTISCRRSINSKDPSSRTDEVLITNI